MASEPVEVEIAGQRFSLNCPQGDRKLLADAVLELNRQIGVLEKRTAVKNLHLLVVVAALNLCKELLLARTEQKQVHRQLMSLLNQFEPGAEKLNGLSRKEQNHATIQ